MTCSIDTYFKIISQSLELLRLTTRSTQNDTEFLVFSFFPPTLNYFSENNLALTGVAQQIGQGPMNQKVAGLIPTQATCLDCGPGPQ